MSPEIKESVIAFIENCDYFKGKQIHIRTALSTNGENFDRHFTTFTTITFELKHLSGRVSGARMMLDGANQSFEIAMYLIKKFDVLENDTVEILEQYAEKIFRKTVIRFEIKT